MKFKEIKLTIIKKIRDIYFLIRFGKGKFLIIYIFIYDKKTFVYLMIYIYNVIL